MHLTNGTFDILYESSLQLDTNHEVRHRTKQPPVSHMIKARRLQLFSNTVNLESTHVLSTKGLETASQSNMPNMATHCQARPQTAKSRTAFSVIESDTIR